MPSNFDCDLGYTIGGDSQPGTFFCWGGLVRVSSRVEKNHWVNKQESNSGATCRNVEECHGQKKGVGYMSMVWYCSVYFKFTLLGVKDCDATDGWNWMELVVPGTNSLFVVFLVPNKKTHQRFHPPLEAACHSIHCF